MLLRLIVCALVLAGCGRVSVKAAFAGDEVVAAQIATAEAQWQEREYRYVAMALEPSVQPEVFKTLSPTMQYRVLSLYAPSLRLMGEARASLGPYHILVASPHATIEDWRGLMVAGLVAGSAKDAWDGYRHGLAKMRDWSQVSAQEISALLWGLGDLPDASEARFAVVDAADAAGWDETSGWEDPSWLWYHYAAALIDRGQTQRAEKVAQRVRTPLAMAVMLADRRFDAITRRDPSRFNVEAAARDWMNRHRAIAQEYPSLMQAQMTQMPSLVAANRLSEARAVLDAILARSRLKGKAGYEDGHPAQALYWKGWLLQLEGRYDEGRVLDASLAETGCASCADYVLAAGRRLVRLGKGQEALDMLGGLEADQGAWNAIELSSLRACAYAELGRSPELEAELFRLNQIRGRNPSLWLDALACTGDQDRLAAAVIEALQDPWWRGYALEFLQQYAPRPVEAVQKAAVGARVRALQTRPDVAAAIDRVGRVNRYDLVRLSFD